MDIIETLKVDEGFRPTMYKCPANRWTIGYGTNLEAGLSTRQAEALLKIAVEDIQAALAYRLSWWAEAPEQVKDALTLMAYQLGVAGTLRFHRMLVALQNRRYEEAAVQALDSKWAEQTPSRAERVAGMFRSIPVT